MDKSGRKALTENVDRMIQSAKSRHAWATDHKLNSKAVERLQKDDHGEKGVSIGFIDELASKLRFEPWQLLVPDLDPNAPPELTTGPQRHPEHLTVGSVALALSRAISELDESRREAIASSVSRLLVKGPNTGEAAVLKLLTQDLTLATSDVFDLDQKNLVTSAQDRPSLTEEDQWDETQERVIKTGLGGPRATTSSMTKPKQDPGKEGQQ